MKSEPAKKIPAAHQKAIEYPCSVAAAARTLGDAPVAWASARPDTVTAMVLSSAVPTEPPICWDEFTIAEATPARYGATPAVALAVAGAKISPSPRPSKMSPGSTVPK